jgi:hypothetical protein
MDIITSLKEELGFVSDPRILGRTRHKLIDILVMTILAIISHAETWTEIEDFCRTKEDWLRKFLEQAGTIDISKRNYPKAYSADRGGTQ